MMSISSWRPSSSAAWLHPGGILGAVFMTMVPELLAGVRPADLAGPISRCSSARAHHHFGLLIIGFLEFEPQGLQKRGGAFADFSTCGPSATDAAEPFENARRRTTMPHSLTSPNAAAPCCRPLAQPSPRRWSHTPRRAG